MGRAARRAADGRYLENGRVSFQKRRSDVAPNTPVEDTDRSKGSEQG